jgi:hypothetical protein
MTGVATLRVRSPRQKTAIAIWIHPKQEQRLSRLKPLIGIERRKRAEQKKPECTGRAVDQIG